MGFSHLHSSEVPLVLNLQTGSITAQFHVVFDDYFSTVSSVEREIDPPNHWAELCLEHTTYIPTEPMPDESTHFLDDDWLTLDEREIKSRTIARSDAIRTTFVPDVQLPDVSSEPPSPAALLKSPVVLIPVTPHLPSTAIPPSAPAITSTPPTGASSVSIPSIAAPLSTSQSLC
jgi:hypothetical protein